MRCTFRLALTVAIGLLASSDAAAAASTDAAVSHLRTAVTTQRNGSHLPLLFSLRQLRDPSLQPLFERLIDHDDWQVQVHAALGLAEVNGGSGLGPTLLTRIRPVAQEAVIASALDLHLLEVEHMRTLLNEAQLETLPRLMLHAELMTLDEQIDVDDVRRFVEDEDLRSSSLACLLLAQHGELNTLADFRSRLENVSPRQQRYALPWLLDAIRQYQFTSANDWIRLLWNEPTLDRRDRRAVAVAALDIDPVGNLDLWREYLGDTPSYADRVRGAFVLLAAGKRIPAETFDELADSADDEPLLSKIIAAGKAICRGDASPQPLIDLLDQQHPHSTDWVMSVLDDLPPAQAEQVYRHLLKQDTTTRRGAIERTGLAVTAAARLFELDPHACTEQLRNTATGDSLQQVLLLGLFESDSPLAGDAAAQANVAGAGREASLRLLLIAKHATTLNAEQKRQLSMIAGGGGRISDVLRVQAAWLHLKHAGKIDVALQRLFPS